jgi:hypothetical protein
MLSTLKYQLFPAIAPGLIAGGVLATYDIFLGDASNKLQAVYDGLLLAACYTAVDYIGDMIPLNGYSTYLESVRDYILKPTLTGLLYSFLYDKYALSAFNAYPRFARLNMIQNAIIGGGASLVSAIASDPFINMLV